MRASAYPAIDFNSQNNLISWNRSSAMYAGICGLWAAGFIANRREVMARSGAPAGSSDLELASALYARLGDSMPGCIHGTLACILWDGHRRRLLAMRDRLGVSEIFYREAHGTVLLSDSLESLLAQSRSPALNARAVLAQIQGQAPAPGETFYQGIAAVEPGGLVTVTQDRIETTVYWRPEPKPLLRLPDDDAYGRAFRDLFLPVVTEYLPPAGEIGVTLSGGLDSTTVAAAAREAAPQARVTAFTWTAPELPEADETEPAAAVCRQLGCRAITIAADQHWPLRSETGIWPEPASPRFNLYTEVWDATFRAVQAQGIRVLLSGQSGDNLFGGDVFSYPDLLLTGRWRRLGNEIREHRGHSESSTAAIVRWMALAPIANAYLPGWERDRVPAIPWLGERLRRERPTAPARLPRRLLPGRRERLRLLRDPLLPVVAALATRHAARYDIDFRHPLLDHRMFEFAAALPTPQTFAAGRRKGILRTAMHGRLPDSVLGRRGKIYPDAIAHRGLREREIAKVWRLMTDMRAADMGFVDEQRLRAAYGDYLAGHDRCAPFWNTLALEAWLRRYFQ